MLYELIPNHHANKPQSWEKLGAVPAKTSKTLSSKARWPGNALKSTEKYPESLSAHLQITQGTVIWARFGTDK